MIASMPGSAPIDDTVPIPPRFWWLKRILIASTALIVVLVALRLWWGWYASRLLQAEIDRIIALGEPIYPEDFDPKEEIPDELNAARLLQQAVAALDLYDEHSITFQAIWDQHEAVSEHLVGLKSLLKDNAQALQLVRRARNASQVDWDLRIRTPAVETSHFAFEDHRMLMKLLWVAAEFHHHANNTDELTQVCLDMLALSDAILAQPTLIAQLVGWAMQEVAVERIERFALVVNNESEAGPSPNFDKALVRQLIENLSRGQALEAGLLRALHFERMLDLDIEKGIRSGKQTMSAFFGWQGSVQAQVPDAVWRFLLTPAVTLDSVRVLLDTDARIRAAQGGRWHAAVIRDADEE